jgi:hypothetical protein
MAGMTERNEVISQFSRLIGHAASERGPAKNTEVAP